MKARLLPRAPLRILPRKWACLTAGALLLAWAFSCLAPVDALADLQKETLSNGMGYVVVPNPGTASVSIDLWVRGGSRCETPKLQHERYPSESGCGPIEFRT